MNIIKKILMTIACINSIVSFAIEDTSNKKKQKNEQNSSLKTICVAAASGIAAGTVIGYWLSGLDNSYTENTQSSDVNFYECQSLSPKAQEIKYRLDGLKKYGQFFDLYDNEQAIVLVLHKLDIPLHQIDSGFYRMLQADLKALNDAGYSVWWYSLKEIEAQKDIYLLNSKKIVSFFYRHRNFIQACQIINSYDELLSYSYDIHSWIYAQSYRYNRYPLISCKNKIESDYQTLSAL